jgi:MFS superfamily sulfate permease-like transporter
MSEVLQANIFFFITSVAVVFVTVLIGVALFYLVSILRNIRDISERVKRGSEVLGRDFSDLRGAVKREGAKTGQIISVITSFFASRTKRRSSRRTKAKQKPGEEE